MHPCEKLALYNTVLYNNQSLTCYYPIYGTLWVKAFRKHITLMHIDICDMIEHACESSQPGDPLNTECHCPIKMVGDALHPPLEIIMSPHLGPIGKFPFNARKNKDQFHCHMGKVTVKCIPSAAVII